MTADVERYVLDCTESVWERFFLPLPLVLVGTREADGRWDLAPKHRVMPLGWDNHIGFVCTESHATFSNARREGGFTVSVLGGGQQLLASLAAAPRQEGLKSALEALPMVAATNVAGPLVVGAPVWLECRLDRVIEGFGRASLICGEVIAASVDESALRHADGDDSELIASSPLLSYLHPGRLATIGATTAFPFPVGMKL